MRTAILLLLSVVFCASAWAAEYVSPADQAFKQPVTLAVKGEALSDIMAMLSKQTGVKLRTAKDIADQKATIFVDKCPLKDVIAGLKTIYGYRFSVVPVGDGKVYELWESLKTKREGESTAQGLTGAARKEIDRRIREVAALTPEDQAKIKDQLRLLESRSQRTPEEKKELGALRSKVGPGAVIAKIYASLSPDIISALSSDCNVYFDSATTESEWRLPESVVQDISKRAPDQVEQWNGIPSGGCNVSLGFWQNGNQLSASFSANGIWDGSDGGRKMSISVGGSPGGPVTIGEAKPEGLETKLPNVAGNDVLDKEVTFTPKELADEADLYGQTETSPSILVNHSDILSLLYKKLGVQSISDHHSYWFTLDVNQPQTVKYLLDHLSVTIAKSDEKALAKYLRQPGDPKSDPVWGSDGKLVLMRERFPRELDALEAPNRVIRRLRTNQLQNRYLDLDDVAEVAALSTDQTYALLRAERRLIYVRGVDYDTMETANAHRAPFDPAVRFYSRLSEPQRGALRGKGLQVGSLKQDQFQMLAKCMAPLMQPAKQEQPVRRVGIWYADVRLDKPQSDKPDDTMPVAVRLVKRESRKYDLRVSAGGGYVARSATAESPEDALKELLAAMPDAKNRSHFLGREMGYTMLFDLPDGTTKEQSIVLYQPVAVDEKSK